MSLVLFLLLLLAPALTLRAAEAATQEKKSYKTQNAILLVLDGERWTETWGDPAHANIPKLAALAKDGVLLTNFRNRGRTETNPAHGTLTTGVYQDQMDNVGDASPAQPSIFQLWRKQTGAPQSAAWVITSKDKLGVLADCTDPPWRGQFVPSADAGKVSAFGSRYRDDKDTLAVILKTLARDHPRLMIINLKEPDSAGHSGNFEAYVRAIQLCDELSAELYNFLRKDPDYAGRTALFITNDHGRHSDDHGGFSGHGCTCDGCRHVMLLALGPDFRMNVQSDKAAETPDIPVTIAELLGFSIPGARGRVLRELFVEAPAAEPALPRVPAVVAPPQPAGVR